MTDETRDQIIRNCLFVYNTNKIIMNNIIWNRSGYSYTSPEFISFYYDVVNLLNE